MKRMLLAVVLCMLLVSPCFASVADWFKAIPEMKQGVMWNPQDNEFSYLTTIEAASWKNIALEVGYSSEDSLVGVISYPILKLKDIGVTIPILDLIEFNVGVGAGYSRIGNDGGNNEFDFGVTLTLLNIHW